MKLVQKLDRISLFYLFFSLIKNFRQCECVAQVMVRRGVDLSPVSPVASRQNRNRCIHCKEDCSFPVTNNSTMGSI